MFIKECKYCMSEFKTKSKRQMYCCSNCCTYFNRKEKLRPCKNCNKSFLSRNENKVHCSDECRSYYKRNILFVEDKNIFEYGFNSVNSYIFGLIMSDGCLVYDAHSSRERIVISSNDLHMLEKISSYIGLTRQIYKNKERGYNLVYINQDAINFLKPYGFERNKSLINPLPNVPSELMSHFIRGYFDGDGSILTHKNKYGVYQQVKFTTGSQRLANELDAHLKSLGLSSGIYPDINNTRTNYYVIVSKTLQIGEFYRYIYNDCGEWFFPRKKEKFIYK